MIALPPARRRSGMVGACDYKLVANTVTSKRRLPPFAYELAEALRFPRSWKRFAGTSASGRCLTLNVTAGTNAWALARTLRASRWLVVVAPPDEDSAGCNWRLLAGYDPILLHVAGELAGEALHALIAALVRDGVTRVIVIRPERVGERFIVKKPTP